MTCPKCGKEMIFYDHVPRIMKVEYGVTKKIIIEREWCKSCKIFRRDLPDYILPFKHYRKDIVKGFMNGTLSQSDVKFEDYPSQSTINEWVKTQNMHSLL
jgi:hypothetical protein